jgi:serine protease AprX
MGLKVPRLLVEFILLGPEDDRRHLQDSPILGDVWVEFARRPGERLELLITPHKEQAAAQTANALHKAVPGGKKPEERTNIAYLQGIVAARLTFDEVIESVLPITFWWSESRIAEALKGYLTDVDLLTREMVKTREEAENWLGDRSESAVQDFETRRRFSVLTALLLWAAGQPDSPELEQRPPKDQARTVVAQMKGKEKEIVETLTKRFQGGLPPRLETPYVWTVSLNRRATPALSRSVPAVKADAARTLFTVNCSQIVWAVIDSGVDATHYAFRSDTETKDNAALSRVKKSFDFTSIRDIVTLDNLDEERRMERVDKLLGKKLKKRPSREDAGKILLELAEGASDGRATNWELVEPFVELDTADVENRPKTNHGTHVAGILAASRKGAETAQGLVPDTGVRLDVPDWTNGMCPDINVYDFRVLAPTLKETEFAIIAALQYIRHVNDRYSFMTIHGANLSLSIPHDVRNFACGRTPVCNECERLVNSGVVVVAAAGNRGYQNFETAEGVFEGYAAFSVTDPGNADGVITVGATHRFWPHTYGVSFFSSRGPTGDGRLKPDLVAPGERIRAPLPGNTWGDLDGTSMAAPHVSGAAAMLMARYSELVGQPRRIKDILCRSATDLGREKSFQGNGMLDVLRAFQSI